MLLNIAGGADLGLFEIDEAAGIIRQAAHDDCNVIFGAVIDETSGDAIRVTVIATGFEGAEAPATTDVREPRFGRREREPAPAAPARRAPAEAARLSLEQSERKGFEIPDDALEIPDFLK